MIAQEGEKMEELVNHAEEYLKTRQELSKMIIAEKTSTVLSSVMTGFVLFFTFFFVFVFASFSLAYFISEYYGKTSLGFVSVTGLYLLTGLLLYFNRNKWMKTPMMNVIIKNFFKHDVHE